MADIFGGGVEMIRSDGGRNRGGGRGEKIMFPSPLNTVSLLDKKADRDRDEMRVGEGAQSNLWFDIASPWLSVSCREELSDSPWSTPCCFNEFT